jgi:hypothetical protein
MPSLCLIAGPIRLSSGRAREFLGLKISGKIAVRIAVMVKVIGEVEDGVEAEA